jgi:hypothetical protein
VHQRVLDPQQRAPLVERHPQLGPEQPAQRPLAGAHRPAELRERRRMWFSGTAREFIERSRRMAGGPLRSKHFIGTPTIEFAGDRALVEIDAILLADHTALGLGATIHNRFLDRVSRRDGAWRIEHRDSVYDLGGFSYPFGTGAAEDVDSEALRRRHPREYAALAFLLESSGATVTGTFPTRFSEQEQAILTEGRAWLAA